MLIGMWSSLGACQAGSELEKRCASVLVMWIVCELYCWSVLESVCSVRSDLAHAKGSVLTVLEWSRAERCNVKGVDGCSAKCERRAAGCQERK